MAWWLKGRVPLGQDVGQHLTARQVLADPATPAFGPGDADLTMAVFTDYRCAACRGYYRALIAAVRADGRVRLLIQDWPVFGGMSVRAARVALAGQRQGRYFAVHDRLMTDPRPLDEATLAAIVAEVGGDGERLHADLATHAAAIDRQLARTAQAAFALGLPGTPSYLIGPRLIIGALDQPTLARAFAQARAT